MRPVTLVVAHDRARGIGHAGGMPWSLPSEMRELARFTRSTRDPELVNVLVMGRVTYESIPDARRPLAGRRTIVVTRGAAPDERVTACATLEEAVRRAQEDESTETIFIFGGASIYRAALENALPDMLCVTELSGEFACDTFFPEIPAEYRVVSEEERTYDGLAAVVRTYERNGAQTRGTDEG